MPETTKQALTIYVERARKVLQHEQRTNHQDQAIKPGGLELFVVRWADEVGSVCKNADLDLRTIHSFTEYLAGYRQQDPMQRAASLRAALAILNELERNDNGQKSAGGAPSPTPSPTPSASVPVKSASSKDEHARSSSTNKTT